MKVQIHLFAAAAQAVAARQVTLEVQEGATLAEVAHELSRLYPQLAQLVTISRWAVDQEFVPLSTAVDSQREIALIPPVSGG